MLTIFKNATNHSLILSNFLSTGFTEDLLTTDSIYVGYYKPIGQLYLELAPHLVENEISVEYWDGSSWSAIDVIDRTFGLKKSGFITWERNIDDQEQHILNAVVLFWYRIKITTNDITDFNLKALNLVFSDDNDLLESYPDIMEYLPEGKSSFVGYHQSARNYILTYLRNKGKTIKARNAYKLLDQFDLHNFEEVRQASKYKALSMIFFNESDQVEDKWYQKAKDFDRLYSESIESDFLSIDENDDGKISSSEAQKIQYITVQRL